MSRVIKLPPRAESIPEWIQMQTGHIQIQLKSTDLVRLRQLRADLFYGATFKDKTPVVRLADVLTWLLEQAELAVERDGAGTRVPKEPAKIP